MRARSHTCKYTKLSLSAQATRKRPAAALKEPEIVDECSQEAETVGDEQAAGEEQKTGEQESSQQEMPAKRDRMKARKWMEMLEADDGNVPEPVKEEWEKVVWAWAEGASCQVRLFISCYNKISTG